MPNGGLQRFDLNAFPGGNNFSCLFFLGHHRHCYGFPNNFETSNNYIEESQVCLPKVSILLRGMFS